ncbi:glycosyltransferase family 4 protein [Halorientalis litorea]|uniref:glycosyltransferase family 4 protein n=1 Tax=Halorientalis litorea TaxID=2931977 RepID=UPI001FF249E7|nr:glycosyltransferase family 4 protein [Halorientalis litorea]
MTESAAKYDIERFRGCSTVTELSSEIIGENKKQEIAILSLALRGSAGVSREIEQQARELTNNGFEVTLFVIECDMEPPEGVSLEVLGTPSNFYLNKLHQILLPLYAPKSIPTVKKLQSYDLLISHRYPLHFLAWAASRQSDIPYITWHYHVPEPEAMPDIQQQAFMRVLEYFEEESWLVKQADVACSISQSSREILRQKSGVDSLVIQNNTESERFDGVEPDVEGVKKEYGIELTDPVVLFVGRLTATKNVLELIETFESVRKEVPKAKLVIAGKPTVDEYFEKLQQRAGENVIFTGFVSDEHLVALYEICDVYATCSTREGRNLPPGEAQEYGATVIGFNVPGVRDIVQDGELVEPENYEQFGNRMTELLTVSASYQ